MNRRLWRSATAAALIWLIDRASKSAAVQHLTESQSIDIAGPWLALTLHRNTGAAFGLGAQVPGGLTLFATGLTLLLFVWWIRAASTETRPGTEVFGLALILGGSAGNLTDRYAHGAVIDFIDLKVWPIFNAADIAITAGAVLWAAGVILSGRKHAV